MKVVFFNAKYFSAFVNHPHPAALKLNLFPFHNTFDTFATDTISHTFISSVRSFLLLLFMYLFILRNIMDVYI